MSTLVHNALTGLKWLIVAVLVLVLTILLLVAGMLVALGSEPGTRWVIEQVPGLDVEGDHGSLLGAWQADRLRWHGYGVTVDVVSPLVDWSPTCLFQRQLCLEALYAERIDVVTQPSEEAGNGGAVELPTIRLPLAVRIGDIRLGPFSLNQTPIWTTANLSADGSGADWQLHEVHYQLDDVVVTASGRVATRGDWPLALNVEADLPPPYGDQWAVSLDLGGSVNDLRVRGASRGYLPAQLQGRLAPLRPDLPATLALTSDRFLVLDTLPATLALHDWKLNLQGDLKRGFATRTQARLAATAGPVGLDLAGTVSLRGVQGLQLEMTGPEGKGREGTGETPPGTVTATGDLDWQTGFAANADIRMTAFPWYSLIPDLEEPLVRLKTFNANGRYEDGRYQADVTASANGPLGSAELASRIEGDLGSIQLRQLTLETGAGKAEGQASLTFSDQLAWQAALTLDRFNPGYWLPMLEASLNGDVSSSGQLTDGQALVLQADWQLAGEWQQQTSRTQGSLRTEDNAWMLSDFSLDVGANHLAGEGQWAERLRADLSMELPAPGALLPGLAGQLSGRVQVSGTPEQPNGNIRLDGSKLAWQDSVAMEKLAIRGTLVDNLTVDADVAVEALAAAGQQLDRLTAKLRGNPEGHALVLTGKQRELATRLRFEGRWQDGWAGVLSDGLIELPEQAQSWQLEAPAALEYRPDPQLTLGSHCWRWQDSSVCSDDQVLFPDTAIRYRLNDFPTMALAPIFPDTFRWQSRLSGELAIALPESGPDGLAELSADAGAIEVQVGGEWHSLAYDTFVTRVSLQPEQAALDISLVGPDIGRFDTHLTVDPRQPDYPLAGQFKLDNFDIALLGPILDVEEIAGMLSGEGRVAGPLRRPQVFGAIYLANGSLVDERLPTPMQAVALDLQLNGQTARISGHWAPHDHSKGQIDGGIDWSGAPSVSLDITGDRLPFNYEPYASVELNPDIALRFAEGRLSVSGQLAVPRGEIKIRRLPEQAVTVSDDEVVMGVEPEEPVLRSLTMDVTVSVGSDEVTFQGFGVDGDLEGTLRLGNDLDTRGILQLVDGTFEAYGQELELRRARLVFVGPVTEPYLDIEAVREVDEVTAGLRLSGPVSEPETEVFSDPSMAQADALSYIILGRPLRSEGDQGQVSQAALSLGLTQASKVTQKIGEEIGIDQLILEAEGSGDEASVVASGYLTEDLSIRYGVGIFDPISTIALRYDLGRYFYLEAASGLAASLDVFYTRDF